MSYYAVRDGRNPGIYNSWDECRDQVNGYSGARYKKFGSAAEAEAFVDGYEQPSYHGHSGGSRGVDVYTDGSCYNNGRDGARAGIGVYWGPGHAANTSERLPGRQTNNRAEIKAAERAVEQARDMGYDRVNVHTDSKFLTKSMNDWVPNWKRNGWKTATGGDVVNRRDFEDLERASHGMDVRYIYVPAHKGVVENERADALANAGAMQELPERADALANAGAMQELSPPESGSDFVGQFESLAVGSPDAEYKNRRKDSGFEDFIVSGKRDQNNCDDAQLGTTVGNKFQDNEHLGSHHDHYNDEDQENNDCYEDGYFDDGACYDYYDYDFNENIQDYNYDNDPAQFVWNDYDYQENYASTYQNENANDEYCSYDGTFQDCYDGNYEYYDISYQEDYDGYYDNCNGNYRDHCGDFENFNNGYFEASFEGLQPYDTYQGEFFDFESDFDYTCPDNHCNQDFFDGDYQDNYDQGYYDASYDVSYDQQSHDQDSPQDNCHDNYQDYPHDTDVGYYQYGYDEYKVADHDSYQQDHNHTESNQDSPEDYREDYNQSQDQAGSENGNDDHDSYCYDSDGRDDDDYYY